MDNSKQNQVFIIESSKTITEMLKTKLEEVNFDVTCIQNGFTALEKIIENPPDCIIADRYLDKLDGRFLCNIVKDGMNLSIPFIIISTKDLDFTNFKDSSCYPDAKIFIDSSLDFNQIVKDIQHLILSSKNKKEISKLEPIVYTTKAMEKNILSKYIYNSIFEAIIYSKNNIEKLGKKILDILFESFSCDIAVLFLNDKPILSFTKGLNFLNKTKQKDFKEICLTDFKTVFNNAKIDRSIFFDDKIYNNSKKNIQNIGTYRCFPLVCYENKIIGTLHVASEHLDFFDGEVYKQLQFFSEKISLILDQTLILKKSKLIEGKLRGAFSRFVPEEIIDELIQKENNQMAYINEKRKVSILVCDIRNFTTISECNQPENVVSFLNGYFAQMVEVIKKHGGSIDKFMGDAIMALFGAPISYTDNAQRALKAALEMLSLLPKISCESLVFPEGIVFDIGIGIHYGEVIVGSIGCNEKSDYTVIGDTVNLASRLEGLTKKYGSHIIISKAVKDELSEMFNLQHIDTVKVKGKSLSVPIYRADLEPLPDDFTKNYYKGIELYSNGAWNLATKYFEKALVVLPNSKSASLLLERCNDFIKNPPDKWDGSISLTTK